MISRTHDIIGNDKAQPSMPKPPEPKYEDIHHQTQLMTHTGSGLWKVGHTENAYDIIPKTS
jgi:hypothetical protein